MKFVCPDLYCIGFNLRERFLLHHRGEERVEIQEFTTWIKMPMQGIFCFKKNIGFQSLYRFEIHVSKLTFIVLFYGSSPHKNLRG